MSGTGIARIRSGFVCALTGFTLTWLAVNPLLSAVHIFPTAYRAKQSDRAEPHATAGLALAKERRLAAAEAELREAVALAPQNSEFIGELATVLAMEGKLDESTSLFEQALIIDPQSLDSRRSLAANLWQLRRLPEAKRNLQILLKTNPGDAQALLLLGMVSENTGDYRTAVMCLAAVPSLVRPQPQSIGALSRSYYHVGESAKARAWLSELKNHPAGPTATLLGAEIADEMRDYETSEALLVSLQPDSTGRLNLSYRLAVVKFHAKQFEQSRQMLQQAIQEGHKTAEVERLLASCYQALKRPQEAIHSLQEAVALEPQNVANYLDLGNILLSERRIVPALELAKRTANAFPEATGAFLLKGNVELEAVHFTDAVDSFTRASHLDASNREAIVGLARAQAGAGMPDQAKATLEAGLARFPSEPRFELALAQLLLKDAEAGQDGSRKTAERLLNSAVAHDEKLAEAHFLLGELVLERGQAERSLIYLNKAVRLAPESAKVHFALARAYRRLGQNEKAVKEADLYEKFKEKETARAPEDSPDARSRN